MNDLHDVFPYKALEREESSASFFEQRTKQIRFICELRDAGEELLLYSSLRSKIVRNVFLDKKIFELWLRLRRRQMIADVDDACIGESRQDRIDVLDLCLFLELSDGKTCIGRQRANDLRTLRCRDSETGEFIRSDRLFQRDQLFVFNRNSLGKECFQHFSKRRGVIFGDPVAEFHELLGKSGGSIKHILNCPKRSDGCCRGKSDDDTGNLLLSKWDKNAASGADALDQFGGYGVRE